MEEWKRGRVEGWKGGKMEGWMWLYKEAQSRMNVLQPYQYVCGKVKCNGGCMCMYKEAQLRMNVLQRHAQSGSILIIGEGIVIILLIDYNPKYS